jgi:hypothetical protein
MRRRLPARVCNAAAAAGDGRRDLADADALPRHRRAVPAAPPFNFFSLTREWLWPRHINHLLWLSLSLCLWPRLLRLLCFNGARWGPPFPFEDVGSVLGGARGVRNSRGGWVSDTVGPVGFTAVVRGRAPFPLGRVSDHLCLSWLACTGWHAATTGKVVVGLGVAMAYARASSHFACSIYMSGSQVFSFFFLKEE